MSNTIEYKVTNAQNDKRAANKLIEEYIPFILSCASKATGRYITESDEEFSVALSAFDEAIRSYSRDKGTFLSFAGLVIKRRITDYFRREYRAKDMVPFSALSTTDGSGTVIEFDAPAPEEHDAKYEIEALNAELSAYGFSFFDIASDSPKAEKTKSACLEAISFILRDTKILSEIKKEKRLPITAVSKTSGVRKKLLERHRRYITAVVLIMTGEYEIIREYFPQLKGGQL